jgi:curved DNA-binding protein CbpA
MEARGVDISKSGIGLECGRELKPGLLVYVHARDGSIETDCVVVHATRRGAKFQIGLEFRDEPTNHVRMAGGQAPDAETDYYDILQISPTAELETVHRVFRIMAARFHPDNPETGDVEQFLRMKEAYSVLSDPARRSEYDSQRERKEAGPMPIFELRDFVTDVDAEGNRRLGVLSILYNQRRVDPDHPGVTLLDLESRMGFPREYLNFTMWYLRSKQYVQAADNSDYTLTAAGADYVEENAPDSEILKKLLKRGSLRPEDGSHARPKNKPERPGRRFLMEAKTGEAGG